MSQHTSSFYGASGAEYNYCVFSKDFKPEGNQYYNYMFASLSSEGSWLPVFIGQGDLKQYLSDQMHVRGIGPTDSTYVLAHVSPDEQRRCMEVSDMLVSYPHAHALTGFNGDNPASASHMNVSKMGEGIPATNKSARRSFPNDQALKSFSPSPQSLDTVWARLRSKV